MSRESARDAARRRARARDLVGKNQLSLITKAVCRAILDSLSSQCDYEVCWRSQQAIAADISVSVRTVKRHIAMLLAIGAIEVESFGLRGLKAELLRRYGYSLKLKVADKHRLNLTAIVWGHPLWQGQLPPEECGNIRSGLSSDVRQRLLNRDTRVPIEQGRYGPRTLYKFKKSSLLSSPSKVSLSSVERAQRPAPSLQDSPAAAPAAWAGRCAFKESDEIDEKNYWSQPLNDMNHDQLTALLMKIAKRWTFERGNLSWYQQVLNLKLVLEEFDRTVLASDLLLAVVSSAEYAGLQPILATRFSKEFLSRLVDALVTIADERIERERLSKRLTPRERFEELIIGRCRVEEWSIMEDEPWSSDQDQILARVVWFEYSQHRDHFHRDKLNMTMDPLNTFLIEEELELCYHLWLKRCRFEEIIDGRRTNETTL